MKNLLSKILMFGAGAAIGSAITYKVVKTEYEKRMDREIEDMRAFFENRKERIDTIKEEIDTTKDILEEDVTDEERQDYAKIVSKYTPGKGVPEVAKPTPKVIPPNVFGTEDDYDAVTLIYYADGVLADGLTDEPIENIDAVVGPEALDRFGENPDEPDIVYVRNDTYGVDYEIQRDARNYSDLASE